MNLILHIEIPGVNVDDWDEMVEIEQEMTGKEPTAKQMGRVFTSELMREEVGITIVSLPGEKEMNSDFGVFAYTGFVVGAGIGVDDGEV